MRKRKWIAVGCACAMALAGAWLFWMAVQRFNPAAVARRLADALEAKLHARPTVYLRKYVVVQEKRPIAELALVSRATDVEHRMESELFFSRSHLVLRGAFNVKAGFDLASPDFQLHLDSGLGRARLEIPAPRVLSLEMDRYDVLEDRSGWWNRISKTDRELALRQMQADAKLEAIRAGILRECKAELEKRLAGISERTGIALEYRYVMAGDSAGPLLAPAEEALR